jgi:hypothetical protein
MTTEGTPPPEGDTPPEEIDDPVKLKSLFDKKKAENVSLRTRATTAEQRAETAEKALEQLKAQSMTDTEKLIETAKREATEEVDARYQVLLKTERLRARSAGKVNDPDDAIRLLDLDALSLDDEEGMDKAIEALIKQKPYLAAKYTVPTIDQGPQGKDEPPKEDANSWLRRAIGGER